MNETDGVVVGLDGDHAWVRADEAASACGACAKKGGCRDAAFQGLLDGDATRLLRLPNAIRARPGDVVTIRADDGAVWRAAWWAYGLPLLLAIAGAMVFGAWWGGEPAAVAGMLFGLACGYGVLRRRGLDSRRAEPILSIGFKRTH